MFLRLLATFLVTLFFGVGNSVKEVPQRILQPRNSSYVYDTSTLEGYYELGVDDNPFNQVFNVQNVTLSSLNSSNYDDFYVGFVTTFGEGVVSYFHTISYSVSNMYTCYQACNDLIHTYWTGTDFFLVDIVRFYYSNSTYYFTNWYRYYLIGEQKMGSICYFEDNILFNYDNYSYVRYISYDIERSYSSNAYNYEVADNIDNRNMYFTRLYTEVRPCLLNSYFVGLTGGNFSSNDIECYLYSFHSFLIGNRQVVDFTPFISSYKLKFGFSHANSTTGYQSGYNDGYQVGYNEGSDVADNELNDKYNEGYSSGYDVGYDTAYDDYYDSRYTQGYNQGVYDESQLSNKYTFANLFGALADTPIMILRSLLGFEVFGTNAMTILMSMVTACIALFVIRKII